MKFNVLTFILAFLLASCSLIEDDGNPCPTTDESEFINLSFRIVAPATGNSRADGDDHEWPEFEDLIYTNDFAFYIYAVLSDEQQPFLLKVDDMTILTDPHTNISGGPRTLTLKVSVLKSDFENVVPKEDNDIKLRIAIFANTNKKYSDLNTSLKYNQFANLIATASDWTYNIFGTIYPGTGTINGNLKSGARIPMYGSVEFEVTREQLYKSTPFAPIWGENIYLLRSLAKVRVIDNIAKRDDAGLPRVEYVTFSGTTDQGYMLPYDAINYNNGSQVTTPKPYAGKQGQLTLFKHEEKKWIGYVPEQSISVDNPKFVVNITYALKEDGTPLDQHTFEIPMTGYNGQPFEFGNNILRNHVYTLSVDGIIDAEAKITAKVKDWTEQDALNLDFTETVYVAPEGKLSWDPESYQTKYSSTTTPGNSNVVMKEWSTVSGKEQSVPLEGKFLIQTPEGATWTAYLIQTAGSDNDAFAFQAIDANGNFMEDSTVEADGSVTKTPRLVNSVSGIIGSSTDDNSLDFTRLRIYTRHKKPSGNTANRAILQILVTVNNGGLTSVIEAPVNPDGIANYVIVQNP